jgi:glycosyltransferase involved in cell wall biosynthesis
MKLYLDVTSPQRSPETGSGWVGAEVARALIKALGSREAQDLSLVSVVRKKTNSTGDSQRLTLIQRLRGLDGAHYHSLDHQIPIVRSAKTSFFLQDLWTLNENEFQDSKFQRRKARQLRSTLRRAERVVTLSQHVAKQLVDYDPSFLNRVTVIPPGAYQVEADLRVEAGDFGEELLAFRKRGRRFLLCVGIFENRKNQITLLKAFERLDPNCDLVLVGSPGGFGSEKVLESVRRCNLNLLRGRVFSFNHLPRSFINELYDGAYALVQPSIDEGFGLPVLEALCRGKALCLSRVPSFFEISGGAALSFDALNVDELVAHLEALLKSVELKRDLEEKSIRRARNWPSWAQVAAKHIEFFRSF